MNKKLYFILFNKPEMTDLKKTETPIVDLKFWNPLISNEKTKVFPKDVWLVQSQPKF